MPKVRRKLTRAAKEAAGLPRLSGYAVKQATAFYHAGSRVEVRLGGAHYRGTVLRVRPGGVLVVSLDPQDEGLPPAIVDPANVIGFV